MLKNWKGSLSNLYKLSNLLIFIIRAVDNYYENYVGEEQYVC
jgi:hypothetical protein